MAGWKRWGAVALVFGIDTAKRRVRRADVHPPLLVAGATDETAHLINALLPPTALRRMPSCHFLAGAALASVLIDLDHLPGILGWHVLDRSETRPVTHSLSSVACAAAGVAATAGVARQFSLGVVCGLLSHLARDMATGGVPLLWPLTLRIVRLPYAAYAAALLALAGAPAARRQVSRTQRKPRLPVELSGELAPRAATR